MTPSILDHLWQSTLLALGIGLLVLVFRRAPAAVRHGLWLAASVKFLVPFSVLAALGKVLATAVPSPVHASPQALLIEQGAQSLARFPFAHDSVLEAPLSAPMHAAAAAVQAATRAAPHVDLPLILLAVWALGSAALLIAWTVRWTKVRAIVRSATPVSLPAPMPVLASPSMMEPGLVGFWRPVLVAPKSLWEHLTRSEIDAILAHEACHLRRRDNLTAAVHMLVEALFWFHPLVWWIGARLIDERERACDEAVLHAGHDRAAYARGLVESCRLYLQSPLNCVAGASGSNLKTRVETILNAPLASPLSGSKKALLLAAGACAFATPVTAGLLTSPAGQQVVAHATAMASNVTRPGVRSTETSSAAAPAPDDSEGVKAIAVALNTVLAPAQSVARIDAAQASLTQDVAAPRVEPPIQLASAQALAPSPALPANPADLKALTASFVQSHKGAFWADALICVRVEGLASDKAAEVKGRIEATAKAAGAHVNPAKCEDDNVEVRFSAQPERALADVIADHKHEPWGDHHLVHVSQADLEALKGAPTGVHAWYQLSPGSAFTGIVPLDPNAPRFSQPSDPAKTPDGNWTSGFALVVVDPQAMAGKNLAAVSDYVAMLVLSKPHALDHCSALPSVTDLFASGCPAPDGLTGADTAYLTALYAGSPEVRAARRSPEVASRMAQLLGGDSAMAATEVSTNPQPKTRDPAVQAASFVQAYAASSGKADAVARWDQRLCMQVVGVPADQASAIAARLKQVAEAAGFSPPASRACQRHNVEIGFTNDPQAMLDGVLKLHNGVRLLGDKTSDTRAAKTVTRPIQAWYETNGEQYAANDGLEALADWRGDTSGLKILVQQGPVGPPLGQSVPNGGGIGSVPEDHYSDGAGGFGYDTLDPHKRLFSNVMVIVDLRQTGNKDLGLITDYVAMLVLAQPQALDRCNALPSVTDLFAGACPGRTPNGLTRADAAYLTALYSKDAKRSGGSSRSAITERMAEALATARVATR